MYYLWQKSHTILHKTISLSQTKHAFLSFNLLKVYFSFGISKYHFFFCKIKYLTGILFYKFLFSNANTSWLLNFYIDVNELCIKKTTYFILIKSEIMHLFIVVYFSEIISLCDMHAIVNTQGKNLYQCKYLILKWKRIYL